MVGIYCDENIHGAVIRALRNRGIDVVTVVEDGLSGQPDTRIVDRATQLQRVLFTHDDDLLKEAKNRQATEVRFQGIVYAHPERVSIGQCVRDLEFLAQHGEPDDFINQVWFLPV